MFCWLTVGAAARFLNLKGALLTQPAGSTEFGSLWKILEKIVLQLIEWPGNWLKDICPSPSVCLNTSCFFLTQFFWLNLNGEYTLPSELAKACF